MKKIIYAVVFTTTMLSCQKETKPCNCGTITNDYASNYSVDIKNDCSGNIKNWVLAPSDWYTAYVGSHFCITNTTSW